MTEAEIIEKINEKRSKLEEMRSNGEGSEVIKSLETEISELSKSLTATLKQNPRDQQVFLDECAG